MLSLGAPYPWIYSLLPPTVFTLLFCVFFLVLFGQFLSVLVSFGKKYYPISLSLSLSLSRAKGRGSRGGTALPTGRKVISLGLVLLKREKEQDAS